MIDEILALNRLVQSDHVVEIAPEDLNSHPLQPFRFQRGSGQHGDLIAASNKSLDQMATDKTGRTGHQRLHIRRSYSRYVL